MHNSTYSLNTLYSAESAQFYSAFLPTTFSLTRRYCRKHEVWLRFFAENAQNDPKTHSREDSAKFNSVFLATTLSHAPRFRRKRGVIENFEYLGEFTEYFQKCWLNCVLYLLVTERCKKTFKNRLWKSRACVPLKEVLEIDTVFTFVKSGESHPLIILYVFIVTPFSENLLRKSYQKYSTSKFFHEPMKFPTARALPDLKKSFSLVLKNSPRYSNSEFLF